MVDTNSDPRPIDFPVPSNDDASKSIEKVLSYLTNAIADGLADRKSSKEKEVVADESKAPAAAKTAEAEVSEKPAEK